MGRAKVTFFMIAYNEEKLIRRAIQSVLDQTEPDIEIYVRNNGSTDRTGAIVREIAEGDGRVHLVENKINWRKDEAGEIPFTNEKGAFDIWPINRETLGDYVAFLDADDSLQPTFVEEMLHTAEHSHAEITVCGNFFMQDGKTSVGVRLPPSLCLREKEGWGPALRNFDTFAQLYNSFRTYWGKLFQREFFLRHYDEAWPLVAGHYFFDTVVMLRYLKRCKRLSCVTKPMYLFTVSSGSTYSNFLSIYSVAKSLQAEALYAETRSWLESVDALTQANHQFLFQLNWAFCWETIEGLQRATEAAPENLDRVITVLNNRVASSYLAQNSQEICKQLEPVLQAAFTKSRQRMELYLRYPIRLMYARKVANACPDSDLLPILIVGILSDVENENLLGFDMLPLLGKAFSGIQKSIQIKVYMDWTNRHNSLRNWWMEQIQRLDGESSGADVLAQQICEAFQKEQYEQASELLSELSKKSPLHREGIYYRIQLAELIGEHELAVVLAASARVLFGQDVEMQQLCWFILGPEMQNI